MCKNRGAAEEYARSKNVEFSVHRVPMFTLAHLFAQHRMARLGWALFDVEGAEELVTSTVDWTAVCARWGLVPVWRRV